MCVRWRGGEWGARPEMVARGLFMEAPLSSLKRISLWSRNILTCQCTDKYDSHSQMIHRCGQTTLKRTWLSHAANVVQIRYCKRKLIRLWKPQTGTLPRRRLTQVLTVFTVDFSDARRKKKKKKRTTRFTPTVILEFCAVQCSGGSLRDR